MKKIAILLTLLCAFSDVCGVYSAWSREKASRKIGCRSIKQTTEASTSNSSVSKSVHKDITKRISKNHITTENSAEQIRIDSEIRKRIQNFAQNLKSNVYDTKQVEDALIKYASLSISLSNGSAKNLISPWTLAHWYSSLGLNKICKDRKNIEFQQKLINAVDQNTEWKTFHKALGKRRNETINALRKLQEKGQISVSLDNEKKNNLIQDYRKKLITNKGLARKYNIKESEVYFVIHEARRNKKDLSLIKIKWKKEYKDRQSIPEKQKKTIVKDYNKGLLTVLGICVKHGITPSVAQALLYSENNANIKRRHGKQHKKDKKLVIDVLTKSSEEIEQKYGYTSVYVDEMKRFVNQWSLLTKGQKKAFSKIMRKKVLPSKYVLASIERSTDRNANEKFDRILFALVSTREEIIEKYEISRKTANRLIREMEFWKILSRKEEPVKDFA